eukprot:TRINITY_DN2279_c0_g1_i1.p1 TRINITY_DN2279_c0_g1~~TRINITY_DN2279_c0_g1_i1.p1  ORF type:complete len:1240 (+),score=456.43 TRINITY_DN2279_c0_g1_i1:412-3720(+)
MATQLSNADMSREDKEHDLDLADVATQKFDLGETMMREEEENVDNVSDLEDVATQRFDLEEHKKLMEKSREEQQSEDMDNMATQRFDLEEHKKLMEKSREEQQSEDMDNMATQRFDLGEVMMREEEAVTTKEEMEKEDLENMATQMFESSEKEEEQLGGDLESMATQRYGDDMVAKNMKDKEEENEDFMDTATQRFDFDTIKPKNMELENDDFQNMATQRFGVDKTVGKEELSEDLEFIATQKYDNTKKLNLSRDNEDNEDFDNMATQRFDAENPKIFKDNNEDFDNVATQRFGAESPKMLKEDDNEDSDNMATQRFDNDSLHPKQLKQNHKNDQNEEDFDNIPTQRFDFISKKPDLHDEDDELENMSTQRYTFDKTKTTDGNRSGDETNRSFSDVYECATQKFKEEDFEIISSKTSKRSSDLYACETQQFPTEEMEKPTKSDSDKPTKSLSRKIDEDIYSTATQKFEFDGETKSNISLEEDELYFGATQAFDSGAMTKKMEKSTPNNEEDLDFDTQRFGFQKTEPDPDVDINLNLNEECKIGDDLTHLIDDETDDLTNSTLNDQKKQVENISDAETDDERGDDKRQINFSYLFGKDMEKDDMIGSKANITKDKVQEEPLKQKVTPKEKETKDKAKEKEQQFKIETPKEKESKVAKQKEKEQVSPVEKTAKGKANQNEPSKEKEAPTKKIIIKAKEKESSTEKIIKSKEKESPTEKVTKPKHKEKEPTPEKTPKLKEKEQPQSKSTTKAVLVDSLEFDADCATQNYGVSKPKPHTRSQSDKISKKKVDSSSSSSSTPLIGKKRKTREDDLQSNNKKMKYSQNAPTTKNSQSGKTKSLPPTDISDSESTEERKYRPRRTLGSSQKSKADPMKENIPTTAKKISQPIETESSKTSKSTPSKTKRKVRVLFTNVQKTELKKLEERVKELGGAVTEDPFDCTHLVSDKLGRTIKFMAALNICDYLVTSQWIHQSHKAFVFLDESEFLLRDAQGEENYGMVMQETMKQIQENPKILSKMKFFLTANIEPRPADFETIIKAAGGEIIKRITKSNAKSIVIISCQKDEDECKEFKERFNIRKIYTVEFVFSAILKRNVDFQQNELETDS